MRTNNALMEEALNALKKSVNNMRQLGEMVNNYSNKLGYGKKVTISDFIEEAEAAIKKAEK